MSRLDELPPDQRAALSLLLRQRKSYAEVSSLLGIAEQAVHDRAQAALVMLAPRRAREVAPERRLEIGNYLLGQQPGVAERLRTRAYLASTPPAREWARELAGELAPLAGDSLPEVPAAAATEAPPPAAQEPQRVQDLSSTPPPAGAPEPSSQPRSLPSSRVGGAVLLAVLVAAVVVAVVLLAGGSGGSKSSTSGGQHASTTKTGPSIDNQIQLKPPHPSSPAVGVVDVVSEGHKRVFLIEAQHIPESKGKGFYYAIWLYNSPKSSLPLSRSPAVGSTHRLAGGAPLPSNAGEYHEILLTKETKAHPSHPGTVVLHGDFSLQS